MPGKETELTARLKPSQRQFFQWHLIEKHSLRTVKDKMDKLTKALNAAGYNYNFVADVKSWKNRSRCWNSTAKKAWKVQPKHKGWDLLVPTELIDVPIWIQWGQNIGDWRSNKSEGKNQRVSTTTDFSSQALVSQANDHHDNHQDTGHWNATQQISTLTEHLEALPNINKPPYLPESTTNHAGIVFSGLTTETIPFPSLPQPDQACNALQDYAHCQNSYRQNYRMATPIFNVNLPFSSSIHVNDHESISYLSDTDPSHAHDESWP